MGPTSGPGWTAIALRTRNGRVSGPVLILAELVKQLRDLRVALRPGLPARSHPIPYRPISLGARRRAQHIDRGQRASQRWRIESGPLLAFPGEPHVRQLNLATGVAPLDRQIQPDERERGRDRFALRVRALGRKGVNDVLVHEPAIAERQ